jgi:hypothetical protein
MLRIGFCLILFVAGCGPGIPERPQVFPVEGEVYYDGKPAEGVQVFLFPKSAVMPPVIPQNPYGTTDALGKFKITTFEVADGAAEGSYQVLLTWPQKTEGSLEETEDKLFNWYDLVNSKLTARIKTERTVLPRFDLPVKKAPPKESDGIPGRN